MRLHSIVAKVEYVNSGTTAPVCMLHVYYDICQTRITLIYHHKTLTNCEASLLVQWYNLTVMSPDFAKKKHHCDAKNAKTELRQTQVQILHTVLKTKTSINTSHMICLIKRDTV